MKLGFNVNFFGQIFFSEASVAVALEARPGAWLNFGRGCSGARSSGMLLVYLHVLRAPRGM